MSLTLPNLSNLLYSKSDNEIWQYFGKEVNLNAASILSAEPFIIQSEGVNYLLTSDKEFTSEEYDNVLLVSKKPKAADFEAGKIKFKRWLKHPLFITSTPEDVSDTWKGHFNFIKEDEAAGVKGLRPPQIGALYSILAHVQNPEDKAIVVMPTGTGKTETMLSALVANECKKLLVSVPSDSLRTQISEKFITLGLLKEYGIVDASCSNPIVGILNSGFDSIEDLQEFIAKANVVVSTMALLTGRTGPEKALFNTSFSHFFIDEAHHSEADTWKELIGRFSKEKVFLFTATPFRNDGKALQGKTIFNFSLRKAQEQKYYKKINYLPKIIIAAC